MIKQKTYPNKLPKTPSEKHEPNAHYIEALGENALREYFFYHHNVSYSNRPHTFTVSTVYSRMTNGKPKRFYSLSFHHFQRLLWPPPGHTSPRYTPSPHFPAGTPQTGLCLPACASTKCCLLSLHLKTLNLGLQVKGLEELKNNIKTVQEIHNLNQHRESKR